MANTPITYTTVATNALQSLTRPFGVDEFQISHANLAGKTGTFDSIEVRIQRPAGPYAFAMSLVSESDATVATQLAYGGLTDEQRNELLQDVSKAGFQITTSFPNSNGIVEIDRTKTLNSATSPTVKFYLTIQDLTSGLPGNLSAYTSVSYQLSVDPKEAVQNSTSGGSGVTTGGSGSSGTTTGSTTTGSTTTGGTTTGGSNSGAGTGSKGTKITDYTFDPKGPQDVSPAKGSTTKIGIYRFFDVKTGGHFFTASSGEYNGLVTSSHELTYEGTGFGAINPSATDSKAAAVYRFFDLNEGGHFFTTSTTERDGVLATRPDLRFEGVAYLEHTTQQTGDVAVYRFFDANDGGHFFAADKNEIASLAGKSNMHAEGIAFYAPSTS